MEITRNNLWELSPGDLVEFKRRLYSHWAVYKGGEEVVHLAGEEGDGLDVNVKHSFTIGGKIFDKAVVRIDQFWDVVAGCKAFKNNTKDNKLRPLSGQEIVERALSKLGHQGYNLIFRNCEHFASWCRYDVEKSGQVESFVTGALTGLAAAAAVGIAYAVSGGSKNKEAEEED